MIDCLHSDKFILASKPQTILELTPPTMKVEEDIPTFDSF